MPGCFVKGCSFSWRQKDPDITLHVFPRDPDMIRKWLLQIYRKEEGLEEFVEKIHTSKKGVYRICSRHFAANCYEKRKLGKVFRKDAIPTIFPWLEPYPIEEERVDHPYAKKRKLFTDLPEESFDDLTADQSSTLPPAIPTPRQFVMSQFASKILSQSFTTSPTVKEEVASPCQSVEEVGYYGLPPHPKGKRYYRPRTRRTVGTMTRRYPGMSHKTVQVDRPIGMKDKAAQILRRPPHRSIALQCNLAKLPALAQAGQSHSAKPVIQKLDDLHTNPNTASFADFMEEAMIVQVIEEDEQPMSPGVSSIESVADLPSDAEAEEISECGSPCVEVEEEFSQETNEHIPKDPKEADVTPIFLPDNHLPSGHVKERKFIVFESCLNKLLMCCKCLGTPNCRGNISKLKKYRIGSAVLVTAICSVKHEFHLWTSQPMIGRMPAGNLLISSSTLCSGSSFFKIESFFNLAGIVGISQPTHNRNQNVYLYPTIDRHWEMEKASVMEDVQSRPVALVADGQCKAYASRAKCCTYNFMDYHTKKIIDFQVEASDPSDTTTGLEKKVFRTLLDRMIKEKVNVCVLCTGRHSGIKKLLRRRYGRIKHQYDVWHIAKSLGDEMEMASRKNGCSRLARWVEPAMSHLWWSVRTCGQNPMLLREKWTSIAHHAADQHDWDGTSLYNRCQHDEEDDESKEWLVAGSEAHLQLKNVVLDRRLLEDLGRLSNFCHADELEVLRSIAGKYHAKRTRYSADGALARTQLAALDYNRNIDKIQRAVKVAESCGADSKARKDWVHSIIYKPTNQDFMKDLITNVLAWADETKKFSCPSQCTEASRKTARPARSQVLNTSVYRVPQMV